MRAANPASGDTIDSLCASLDATALRQLLVRREISPVELVEAACRNIERTDPLIGAVSSRLFEEGIERARSLDPEAAPFAGIPFLMKDVGARQQGQPYYAGNRALRDVDHRAAEDTVLGARFREIGLVTIGNSNAPEFGLQSNTWPLAHGPTHNPWNRDRSAGGSSGGACAAVVAGLVPVAHASDGAGSIRIPAAWCGLIGLKPSRDRVVWRHAGSELPEVEFVVARSLRDTAALLDVLRADGPTPPAGSYAACLNHAPPRLRIGLCAQSPDGSPVDPACREAAEHTARQLESLGHAVEESAPSSFEEYHERALYGAVLGPSGYLECLFDLEERLGRSVGPDDVEPFLWELSQHDGDEISDADREAAARWSVGWNERTLAWFETFDLLLTPTVSEPAPPLASLDPTRLAPLEMLERMVPHMAFTEPWNATGQPAISLPLAHDPDGMPVGVQLVARRGREDLLLSTAACLVGPIPDRKAVRPGIHA